MRWPWTRIERLGHFSRRLHRHAGRGCGRRPVSQALATTSFERETQRDEVRQIAAKLILVDSLLARYGPEAHAARDLQRQAIASMIARIWGEAEVKVKTTPYKPSLEGEAVIVAIESLSPQTEAQRNLKLRALQTTAAIVETRVLLFEQTEGGLPVPLLVG